MVRMMILNKDVVGAFISSACLIHCLAGPVLMLLGITSLGHAHIEEQSFHFALTAPILLVAAWSIPKGLKSHHHKTPAILSVIGIALLSIGLLIIELNLILSVGGSLFLLIAHLYNRKLINQIKL